MAKSPIKGKWALVTGSSRGIGRQIAKGLAALGCHVYVHGRKKENTEKTLSMIKEYKIEAYPVKAELSSDSEIRTMVQEIMDHSGGVDILYNNAAVMGKSDTVWNIPQAEWKRVFQVNLYAVIQLCAAFATGMRKRNYGRIINLTSGIKDQPELAPYSVSKAAIDKYSRDIAFELKESNVLVNYLDPGWLKTDMGGQDAWSEVETVLPGALVPALLEDNGPTGQFYCAQDFKHLTI